MEKKVDVYERVTNKIIDSLEKGLIPWNQSWCLSGVSQFKHFNYVSKKCYRGVNPLILNCEAIEKKYKSNFWITFNQCKKLGKSIKKGEKSTFIVFWKFINKKETEDGKEKILSFPILKYFNVFNIEQTTIEIEEKKEDTQEPISLISKNVSCENIIFKYKYMPEVKYGKPSYYPLSDKIKMPNIEDFENSENYYSTFFHEIIHSTGHENRLNRAGIASYNFFGSERYSKEELVAELGSAFLSDMVGISKVVIKNQTAYIKGWLKELKNNKKLIVTAAAGAEKATEYILNEVKEN